MKRFTRKIAGGIISAGMIVMMPGCSYINMADYSGFTNIPPEGMPTGWEYEFSPEASDSTISLKGRYDLAIAVRYTNHCPSASVIFNIEELSLVHEKPDSTVVEIPLFDIEGQAIGQSRFGVNETLYILRKGFTPPEGYVLSLSSPLPSEATTGIKAVGIVLVNEDKPEKLNNIFWQLL